MQKFNLRIDFPKNRTESMKWGELQQRTVIDCEDRFLLMGAHEFQVVEVYVVTDVPEDYSRIENRAKAVNVT